MKMFGDAINFCKLFHCFWQTYLQKPQSSQSIQLRPYLNADTRSPDERAETRFELRRRYGQVHSAAEWAFMCGRRVYDYEWIYMRNKKATSTVHWRMPFKPRFTWPEDKIALGVRKARANERIDLGA